MLEEMQGVAFQIIAIVGTAKSMYIEAIQLAKKGDIEEAKALIKEGEELFSTAHTHHFGIVQKEASGEQVPFSVMFMHAEDQLLNTETIKIMADEMVELYEKLK